MGESTAAQGHGVKGVRHYLARWRSPLGGMVGGAALLLLACSSLRHALFQSSAYDLGIFDQAVYLIQQGQPPFSSILGFHILGDHAALVLYPLAVLYALGPNVHWLLAVQAVALAGSGLLVAQLARQAGLSTVQVRLMVLVYLLYPLVFNVNLFDFHPDVLALPGLLGAVWAARARRLGWFALAIGLVLSCKAVLALTVAALGVWLLVSERRRWYGVLALVAGSTWFLIATLVVIPHFGGHQAELGRHLYRYSGLGASLSEVAVNLLTHPDLLLQTLITRDNLEYVGLLIVPVLWGLSWRQMMPLMAALPALTLNLLSSTRTQKDLVYQYSLPILPFLLLAVIGAVAANQTWVRQRKVIVLWAAIAFLALAKYDYFGSLYLRSLPTWSATRAAVAQVPTAGSVLATANIAPHLTHRPLVQLAIDSVDLSQPEQFDLILLNLQHPRARGDRAAATTLATQLQQDPRFQRVNAAPDVYLFRRRSTQPTNAQPE